jgi:hypothetical protein
MAQPVVLIIFSCQTGDTEKFALNAAVGAIQARALIRLRRLPDADSSETTDTLLRMRKEYVAPTEADILGADVVILVSNASAACSITPWNNMTSLLHHLQSQRKLDGKVRAAVGGIATELVGLGFTAPENAMMDPVAVGRDLAGQARTLQPE